MGASAPDSGAPGSSSPPATTPPRRPTPDDVDQLTLAAQLELSARDLYQAARDQGADDGAGVFSTIALNHVAYANAIAALLGVQAPRQRDDATYDEFASDFESGDATAVATAGYDLESRLTASHLDVVGRLVGSDGARVLTSILLIESSHCAVLADLIGKGDDLDALLVNSASSAVPEA